MELNQLFDKSRLTLISGQAKSTKLSFCLYALIKYSQKASLRVISPSHPERMLARLKISQTNINCFSDIDKQLTLQFIKDDWSDLKVSHGLELLNKDLEKLFQHSTEKFILFHLFNRLFEIPDRRFIEPTIETIAQLAKKHDKQVFFTCDSDSENYVHIMQSLNTHADLIFNISNGPRVNTKYVDINYSIYPVEVFRYVFSLQNGELSLEQEDEPLNTTSEVEPVDTQPQVKNVLLLSTDQRVIDLHHYFLGGNDLIKLKVCRNLSEALAALLSKPALVINHCDDIEEHYGLSAALKQNHVTTNLIFMINKSYVREEDRIKASQLYNCNKIFDSNLRLVDYILEIEKDLDLRFYSRLSNQARQSTHHENRQGFNDYMAELKNQRVVFCIHHFQSVLASPKRIVAVLRDNDSFFIDQDNNLWLICVNSQEEDAQSIHKKLLQIAPTSDIVKSYSILTASELKLEELTA